MFSFQLTLVPVYTAWWTEADVCEQLVQGRHVNRCGRDSNVWPIGCESDVLTTAPPHHTRLMVAPMNPKSFSRLPCTHTRVKPGFHYPSWRPELTGDRFPLPVNTGRVDGPCWRAVNSGSGNGALTFSVVCVQCDQQHHLTVSGLRRGWFTAGQRHIVVVFVHPEPLRGRCCLVARCRRRTRPRVPSTQPSARGRRRPTDSFRRGFGRGWSGYAATRCQTFPVVSTSHCADISF